MERNLIIKYLEPNLGIGKFTKQGVKFCCPDCDKKGSKFNLEVNLSKSSTKYLIFHCWSCHYKGHLKFLLAKHANTEDWRKHIELSTPSELIERNIEIPELKSLPKSIAPYHVFSKVNDYFKERNLDENILLKRKVQYCYSESEKLYNKVLFPYFENNVFIGFSSQDLDSKSYFNHRDLNFVAYKDLLNPIYPIIVTEGIYDSFSVPNSTPMLGTKPSKALLKYSKGKRIILALDNDISIDVKKEMSELFYENGAKVVAIFDLNEYKDLNEYRIKEPEALRLEMKDLFSNLIKNY